MIPGRVLFVGSSSLTLAQKIDCLSLCTIWLTLAHARLLWLTLAHMEQNFWHTFAHQNVLVLIIGVFPLLPREGTMFQSHCLNHQQCD